MLLYHIVDRFLPRRLQVKLSLLVTCLLIFLVSLVGALFSDSADTLLHEQIGEKAIEVATTIAFNDLVIQAVKVGDARGVQEITKKIRVATQAEFVVDPLPLVFSLAL